MLRAAAMIVSRCASRCSMLVNVSARARGVQHRCVQHRGAGSSRSVPGTGGGPARGHARGRPAAARVRYLALRSRARARAGRPLATAAAPDRAYERARLLSNLLLTCSACRYDPAATQHAASDSAAGSACCSTVQPSAAALGILSGATVVFVAVLRCGSQYDAPAPASR